MFPGGIGLAFVFQHFQRSDDMPACIFRENDTVDITEFCGMIGIREGVPVFFYQFLSFFLRVFGSGDFLAENDIGRTFSPHYGNFSQGIGQVDVAADMFGGHHHVSAAVPFARNNGHLGNSGFAKGI